MKNAALLLVVFTLQIWSSGALASCPDMNGNYVHTQLFVRADMAVTQTQCDSVKVHMTINAPGTNIDQTYDTPLDGVTRDVQSPNANERDTVSGKFVGDTMELVVDRYLSNGNHTTTLVTATMTNADTIVVNLNGSNYDFNRD